jgi:hypothetical protein
MFAMRLILPRAILLIFLFFYRRSGNKLAGHGPADERKPRKQTSSNGYQKINARRLLCHVAENEKDLFCVQWG